MDSSKDQPILGLVHDKHDASRKSIKKSILFSALSVVILFVLFITALFIRFNEYQNILSEIKESSIPLITDSSQLYTQINRLTSATDRLIYSENIASHELNINELDNQIAAMLDLISNDSKDQYFARQLNVILAEIGELSALVREKIKLNQDINEHRNELVIKIDSAINLLKKPNTISLFSELNAKTSRILISNKLNEIKKIKSEAKEIFSQIRAVDPEFVMNNKELFVRIQNSLISDTGIIEQHINYLRKNSRVMGRSNFVRNIIIDFASEAEFTTNRITNDILKRADQTNQAITNDLYVAAITLIIVIILTVFIANYLRKRIVKRLLLLDREVHEMLYGKIKEVSVAGNDEISDIAETFNIFSQTLELQKQSLEQLTMVDGLTGIANRRAFDDKLSTEWQSAHRHEHPISLLMIDIDFFKPYNDNYGHAKGDECLTAVAKGLTNCITRQTDFLARYGGEEFVVILPNTALDGAEKVANQLRTFVFEQKLTHEYSEVAAFVTISIGAACIYPNAQKDLDENDLIVCADKALYAAKLKGRNLVQLYNK